MDSARTRAVDAHVEVVFWAVVGARFVLPLFIFRFPLPAILASLVLDAADQTVFAFFGYDPPNYQGYDKAMDIYYLALAFIATMRNWTSEPAFEVSRFLYFYRLIGVTAFELTQLRPLLLIFPNTFEYFFITYEGIRTRWNPRRFGTRFWIRTAAAIWIFVKLPQEYWIHIAQLDFTDTVATVPWFAPTLAVLAIVAGFLLWYVVRPRLRPADWTWRFGADRLPAERDIGTARKATVARGRVLNPATIEKLVLGGLIVVIFGQIMPDLRVSNVQLFVGAAALVVIDAAVSLALAGAHRSVPPLVASLGLRAVANIGLVVILALPLRSGQLNRVPLIFFALLLTLITGLYDRYRPVHVARSADRSEPDQSEVRAVVT